MCKNLKTFKKTSSNNIDNVNLNIFSSPQWSQNLLRKMLKKKASKSKTPEPEYKSEDDPSSSLSSRDKSDDDNSGLGPSSTGEDDLSDLSDSELLLSSSDNDNGAPV